MKGIIQQRLADSISMKIPGITEREYRLPEIPNKTFAVIGMRRSGKTYFLYQTIVQYLKQGINRSRLVYFNFEDERLSDMTAKDLHWITDEYYAMFPENRQGKVYFFFDEIQQVRGWEKYVRRLMDSENVQIFISGSSAKMLSREIASSMRGRSIETIIYPYSYREFIKKRKIKIPPKPLSRVNKQMRSLFENQILEYLKTGGFPEAQNISVSDRHLLLQGYVNTVIFRDIVERFNVSNIIVLKILIRHLLRNYGSRFTVNKFYNQLKSQGIKVAKTTLHDYLHHLYDVFLIYALHLHTKSERKRMVNPIKTYTIDTGLAAAYSIFQEQNIGRLLENCIFIELCRRNSQVTYFITESGYEIDFIVRTSNEKTAAIQVASDISNQTALDRETRALIEVGSEIPGIRLCLINLSEEKVIKKGIQKINVIPAWKWLLDRTQ